MKRLLAVIMTSVLTWWMVGWYLQKEQGTVSAQDPMTDHALSLKRTSSAINAPPKLSSQWLESITQRILTLTPAEFKVWEARIKDWPPITKALVQQLLDERKAVVGLLIHSPNSYSSTKRAAKSLMDQLRDQSPEEIVAAIEALDHRGQDSVSDATLRQFFEELAQEKPQQVAEAADLMRHQDKRKMALDALAKAWATQDAQACLTWAEARPNTNDRALLGNVISQAIRGSDAPLVLLELAPRLEAMGVGKANDLARSARLAWAQQQTEQARTWLQENPDQAFGNAFAIALSRSDPEEAIKHLDLITDSISLQQATTNIVQYWWSQNPTEALEWAKAQEAEIARVVAAENLAYQDPKQALELLENAWASGQELGNFDRSLTNIADRAPDLVFESTLLEQLDDIPHDTFKYLSSKSPTQAISLLEQFQTMDNLRTVAEVWLEQDADAAAAWVGDLPQESLDEIAPRFVTKWAKKDATAARQWINESLPKDSTAYEKALSELGP